MKWASIFVAILFLGLIAFSVLQRQSLRSASLIYGKNCLKVAYEDFNRSGYITNYLHSAFHVSLDSDVVTINDSQYQLFARVEGGWGYDGGSLAMTTNQILIWLDPERPPKVITNGFRPSLFSKRY